MVKVAEQRIPVREGRDVLQSRLVVSNVQYLLFGCSWTSTRTPDEVVTVYKTSKLDKYWRNESWKVLYDPGTDILTVILKEGVPAVESDEDKPGVILDYEDEGKFAVFGKSRRVTASHGPA